MSKPTVAVALLRGINVGGHKKVPMAELRELSSSIRGISSVETYIQSGNVVFEYDEKAIRKVENVESLFEQTIEKHFGFSVDVIVRTASRWFEYAQKSPFPDAEQSRPNLLHLGVTKSQVAAGAQNALSTKQSPTERVLVLDDAVWIDFGGGVAKSKLTPTVLNKVCGSTVTARNWRTVQTLADMMRARR